MHDALMSMECHTQALAAANLLSLLAVKQAVLLHLLYAWSSRPRILQPYYIAYYIVATGTAPSSGFEAEQLPVVMAHQTEAACTECTVHSIQLGSTRVLLPG